MRRTLRLLTKSLSCTFRWWKMTSDLKYMMIDKMNIHTIDKNLKHSGESKKIDSMILLLIFWFPIRRVFGNSVYIDFSRLFLHVGFVIKVTKEDNHEEILWYHDCSWPFWKATIFHPDELGIMEHNKKELYQLQLSNVFLPPWFSQF